ncbi:hypothetical protein ONZ45_g2230 [Pleurotus djamor]|nr:hypothetical protein ONZ45_g2230 [Pleurotus djamor]
MVALLNFAVGLAMPLLAFANQHGASVHVHRHKDIAARVSGDMQIHKRFSGTRWTWYDVGLGACGKYNVPSDFIVALNSAQYGGGYPGPQCFKSITLSFGGKTANAVIMDECPSCPYGGLDLSKSLFQHFADLGVGVLSGEWHFNDGSSEPKPDPPKPKTTTTKAKPKPTPTSTPPPPPPPPNDDLYHPQKDFDHSHARAHDFFYL